MCGRKTRKTFVTIFLEICLGLLAACNQNTSPVATITLSPSPTVLMSAQSPTATILPTESLSLTLPTLAPTPQPVWRILFVGIPCPEETDCDETLAMDNKAAIYRVNSDGTGLTPLAEISELPASLSTIGSVRFSADEKQIGYIINEQIAVVNIENSSRILWGGFAGRLRGFDFLPESDCLATYVVNEKHQLIVTQVCNNTTPKHQTLDVIAFPGLLDDTYDFVGQFRLSPDGKKLLAYNIPFHTGLYVKEIASAEPPHLVFDLQPPANCSHYSRHTIEATRWRDAESIEFVMMSGCSGHIATTFNSIHWYDGELDTFLTLPPGLQQNASVIGDSGAWSPNGQEFVIVYNNDLVNERILKGNKCGLYTIDLSNGKLRLAVPGFLVIQVSTWGSNSYQ